MAEFWLDKLDNNYEQFDWQQEFDDLTKSTVESIIWNENVDLKTKENYLITQFDTAVIKRLVDWKHIRKKTLKNYERSILDRSPLFKELVQEAIKNKTKLSGNFGRYVAWLVSLRQIIAKEAWKDTSKFAADAFFKNLLWIDLAVGEPPIEDIIDHWDANECYCMVPIQAKQLLDENYKNCYESLKIEWLANVNIPSKAG